jgi:hypothetical protein
MSRPTSRIASSEDVGRSCPYCRFAFKQGTDVVACGFCHAAHHADCWADNGGCAIMGCEGAPSATAHSAPTAVAPPAGPPAGRARPPVAPPPPPAPPPAPAARQRPGTALIAACVIALLAAGAAVAAVLTRPANSPPATTSSASNPGDQPGTGDGDGTNPGTDANANTGTDAGTDPNAGTDTGVTPPPPPPPPPPASPPSSGALKVVTAHFEHLRDGEYQAAFNLFIPSYQGTAGSSWVSLRSTARPGVNIISITPLSNDGTFATMDAKIVTRDNVRVAGSDTQCRRFTGTLAARKQGGRWYYSPGENHLQPAVLPPSNSQCP